MAETPGEDNQRGQNQGVARDVGATGASAPEPVTAKAAGAKPAAKKPVAQKPAVKKPATAKPAAKTPATKTAAAKTSAAKATAAKSPATKSAAAKAVATKSPAEKSPAEKTTAAKTSTAKPAATQHPAAKTSAAQASAATTSAVAEPSTKPATAKTGVKKPAAKKPAAKKPASTKPASTKPAAKNATENATEKAIDTTPAAAAPSVEAPAAADSTASTSSSPNPDAAPTVDRNPASPAVVPEPAVVPLGEPVAVSEVALSVTGLSKSYDGTVAVDGISLSVPRGAMFGLLGPNGAGKTTTLSMISGLLRPDAGTVTVDDIDVWADPIAAKRRLGILPDRMRLFDRLTGAQLLHYAGTLRGLPAATVRTRTSDLAEAFGLRDVLGKLVRQYSVGMAKKVALAAAMIHAPRLLILDEPFESVDPVSTEAILAVLRNYVEHGGTVILSSHQIELIERECSGVAIIADGAVRVSGSLDEVRGDDTLLDVFHTHTGELTDAGGMSWLHSFSA